MNFLPVVLSLVLCEFHCVLPHTDHDYPSENHVKKKLVLFRALRKRETCGYDEYKEGTRCCKNCQKGTHVESHCTENHGNPTCRACTEGLDYMDERNGYPECLKCRSCDSESGLELLKYCTVTQNTKCKCRHSFFCKGTKASDPEDCAHCDYCNQCELYGVAEQCTATNDTVCKKEFTRSRIAILFVAFPIVIIIVCLRCSRNTMQGNKGARKRPEIPGHSTQGIKEEARPEPPAFPDHLKDIDLTNYLCSIACEMEISVVLLCVRNMQLKDTEVESVNRDYQPSGTNEVKYQLLKKWYEAHGRNGAFQSLITTLQKNNYNNSADMIMKFVSEQVQEHC